ncbi:hypothetical protein KM043_003561 [Ampulex compressa]|nr:hypothetical protein KM043_003561 [Ampulex compressa]
MYRGSFEFRAVPEVGGARPSGSVEPGSRNRDRPITGPPMERHYFSGPRNRSCKCLRGPRAPGGHFQVDIASRTKKRLVREEKKKKEVSLEVRLDEWLEVRLREREEEAKLEDREEVKLEE